MGAGALSAVLLDTHAWVWGLMDPRRLGESARATVEQSDLVYVSPISVYEVTQKVRLGRWPEITPHIEVLVADEQALSAPLTRQIAARAGLLDWAHRDPFDRLIAATAIEVGCRLVSKDEEFDELRQTPGWSGRIWEGLPRL